MGKNTRPRRAISVKDVTYQRIKNYCDANGISLSSFVEDVVAEKMDAAGEPVPDRLVVRSKKTNPDEIISQHFTF